MATNSIILNRKRNIVYSLCKRLSLDPEIFLGNIEEIDLKSLCCNILKSSRNVDSLKINDEVIRWIEFAENFPVDSQACFGVLNNLNEDLAQKSVLQGNGLKPLEADVVAFSVLHSFVIGFSSSEWQKLPHVMRWMDYIQNTKDIPELFARISVEKPGFEPPVSKIVAKMEADSNATKIVQGAKNANNLEADQKSNKSTTAKKAVGDGETAEKKKLPDKEAVEKDKEVSISLLNIQVGLIRKAWKHPSADSLLVEEIDIGDAKLRQVVSGLAKYCNPVELMNRRVVLITNVKPGKLRDVMSEGLVLCASNEDRSIVEPLLPPEGSKLGERVSFSGIEGKPEAVLNPKKKQLEKVTPHLFTDGKGMATFKGVPFMTSAGPCTSSISNASIK
ncbi:methionine--tRNA ligase, cytoplasmic [Malania oleifera]|uniref:methionine--tRNA ligase, cytoplasmic n=1 Tax=Malania oleifera TaxID=397392 RepID=UPI0025ADD94C|nr:methionine--tRNA ligase, cytoplasmic [Malania oleifera]